MAVTANLGTGAIDVGITDTVLIEPAPTRFAITAAMLTNNASAARTIEVYESPDLTSAAGKLVETIVLDALESFPIESIIGQSYSEGSNVLVLATDGAGGDVIARATFTSYSGDS